MKHEDDRGQLPCTPPPPPPPPPPGGGRAGKVEPVAIVAAAIAGVFTLLIVVGLIAGAIAGQDEVNAASTSEITTTTTQPVTTSTTRPPTTTSTTQPTTSTTSAAREVTVFRLNATARAIDDDTIEVSGTTNLPDGALINARPGRALMFEAERLSIYVGGGMAKAADGKWSVTVDLDDHEPECRRQDLFPGAVVLDELDIEVRFNTDFDDYPQPAAVLDVIGDRGQALETSPDLTNLGAASAADERVYEIGREILLAESFSPTGEPEPVKG